MSGSFGLPATAETSLASASAVEFPDAPVSVSAGVFRQYPFLCARDRPVRFVAGLPADFGEPAWAGFVESFSGLAHHLVPCWPGRPEVAMAEGRLDQINEHFAHVTGLLEDAHEIAVAGQSGCASPDELMECAKALRRAVDRISAMISVIKGLVSWPQRVPFAGFSSFSVPRHEL